MNTSEQNGNESGAMPEASNIQILNAAYEQKFRQIPVVNYSKLPIHLLRAYVVLILSSIVITPEGIRIGPETGTKVAILAGEAGLGNEDSDANSAAMNEVEGIMDILPAIRNSYDVSNIIGDMLETANGEPTSDSILSYMIDDAISVAQMITTSKIMGEHIEVLTSQLATVLNISQPLAAELSSRDEPTEMNEEDEYINNLPTEPLLSLD